MNPQHSASQTKPTIPISSVRRHCKIARLPPEIRHRLNTMLHDGATYSAIVKHFHQHNLNEANLSRWHAGGFQDWLHQQGWLDEMRGRMDFASAIVKEPNADLLDQASLRIAVTRMYSLLTQFDPAILQLKLAQNPGAYVRVLNALCHLTQTAIKLQRDRDQKARKPPSVPVTPSP